MKLLPLLCPQLRIPDHAQVDIGFALYVDPDPVHLLKTKFAIYRKAFWRRLEIYDVGLLISEVAKTRHQH